MKIVYIHQYFNTPETGGPLRSWYLSNALVKAGHEVDLITSHNSKKYKIEIADGVRVHYLPVSYDNSYGFWQRLFSFCSFIIKALSESRHLKADLCIATSTPLTVGLLALYFKWAKKIPYIFEVRDLWPRAPIEMGFVRSPVLKNLLKETEKTIYKNATCVIGLSDPISEHVRLVSNGKVDVHTITNISDCDYFANQDASSQFVNQFQIPENKFIISYFGAAGFANGLDKLLLDAEKLQKHTDKVHFVVAATGKEIQRIRSESELRKLKNIKFLPYLNRKQLAGLLAISQFSYLSYADYPVLGTGSPNKLFDSLAAGLPVISNIYGWWSPLLAQYQCGITITSSDCLYLQLKPYLENPKKIAAAKSNALELARQLFERKSAEKKYINIVSELNENGLILK